jgi:N-acetylglucosamine-6-phosphate deacetylase
MMRNAASQATVITNARLVLSHAILEHASLEFVDGVITAIHPAGTVHEKKSDAKCRNIEYLDVEGDTIIPGLVDLHVHGCGGADVMDEDPQALQHMANALLQQGTTGFLATTMTAANERIEHVLAGANQAGRLKGGAEFLGFHLEGPCISDHFRGAQMMRTSEIRRSPLSEQVRIITLAPELPEAAAYFNIAAQNGIILSVGHSGASYEQMQLAIEQGACYVTHAFNAMPGIHHRLPGLLTAALLDSRVVIELIADGVHIHPAVLELALRLKGVDNIVLVSDGTRAVGLPDGDYELGGQTARLSNGRMTLPDGTIAGSASPLLAGVRLMTDVLGRPLFEAVRMASLNPARVLGVEKRIGSLAEEKAATFVRLNKQWTVKQVWRDGCASECRSNH